MIAFFTSGSEELQTKIVELHRVSRIEESVKYELQ